MQNINSTNKHQTPHTKNRTQTAEHRTYLKDARGRQVGVQRGDSGGGGGVLVTFAEQHVQQPLLKKVTR
jgi:hypothetical protein